MNVFNVSWFYFNSSFSLKNLINFVQISSERKNMKEKEEIESVQSMHT